ncbi:MAG: cbb3-type cytochrome oxidase assembly protein CcoS [Gammaproteobacteria bacterium]|nr:cbb3-type cytochrome oxidase assembly protein CcoS [Gammaproteobacteria bacterium]
MQILIVLIPISIILIGIAAVMFLWAVDNDQFEQLDLHAFDILQDDSTDDSGESP